MKEEQRLSAQDIADLRWAASCNGVGIGYLGPTVKRCGPLPEIAPLVTAGLLRCDEDFRTARYRNAAASGYWITDAGRQALSSIRQTESMG